MEQQAMAEALEPFANLLTAPAHRQLVEEAMRLSSRFAPEKPLVRRARECLLAGANVFYCSPPSASSEQAKVCLKYLLVFFMLDDEAPSMAADFVAWLDGRVPHGCDGPAHHAATCCAELFAELEALGGDTSRFRAALRRMSVAMQQEKQLRDRGLRDLQTFHALRIQSIGVFPFIECWRAIRVERRQASPVLEARIDGAQLDERVAEVVYLVNDLASLERDEESAAPEGGDPNYILLRMTTGRSREDAIADAIALHNLRIEELRRGAARLLQSPDGDHPVLLTYLELLQAIVRGNLAASKALIAVRFPGAARRLSEDRLLLP